MASGAPLQKASDLTGEHPERQYLDLLGELLANGDYRADRTGVGAYSLFGRQMRFDLAQGFPLLTTKRIFFRGAVHEMIWFLSGDTNVGYLRDNGVTIWDEWADENGELGPVYGKQWRAWTGPDGRTHDQMGELVKGIRENPASRRLLFTGWNVGELDRMALPPCHMTYQFHVADGRLSGLVFQRSADVFLGLGWNVAEAALLIHMLAQQCDLDVGELVWMGGDVHLYANHVDQARQQLERAPRQFPRLDLLRRPADLFSYAYEDFSLAGYDPHPAIAAAVAV
ncbi:thymidylate synthase [Hansschlegelia quercus]|uniref:Thymidylate synthase n=1 Tax=Hansschlegelia quercus TaxID=2528245 RepID=A0A4Q9GK34_9HYPH|nr:thymidylate synthase [Hansschlegelia quercus]TBN54643.1 thymidylate synthase [Hansschlegelia quercus]